MRRKGTDHAQGEAFEHPAPPTAASRMLTPLDIQQKEFRVSRFGGYRMRDVDEFLDELTEAMTALQQDNERLRRSGDRPPAIGAPDLDEVSRQADEIIARARAEAERIVAEARAASPSGRSAPVAEDERAAVEAFLAQERRFLQGLAGLVQEHADTVKSMARDVRRRPAAAEAAPVPGGTGAAGPTADADGGEPTDDAGDAATDDASGELTGDAAGGRAVEDTLAMPPVDEATDVGASDEASDVDASDEASDDEAASRPSPRRIVIDDEAGADEPLVVEEPEPARARREEPERRGDASLRELFWGEDA
ncbi:MAG TPA: DivIVA domain-containing protein [Actinomycetota bacterium]